MVFGWLAHINRVLCHFQVLFRIKHLNTFILLYLVSLVFSENAIAFDLDVRRTGRSYLDFSLQFQKASLDLVDRSNSVETDFTRIGVAVFDVAAESSIHTGLLLGYAFADHPDQQLAQGLEMDGAYLGITIRSILMKQDQFRVDLQVSYLYQETGAADEGERLSLEWNEFRTAIRGSYTLNSVLRVVTAANYDVIDAKQRYRGAFNQTLKLENDSEAGVMLGFDYLASEREYIGFHFDSGSYDGVNIIFQKLF